MDPYPARMAKSVWGLTGLDVRAQCSDSGRGGLWEMIRYNVDWYTLLT